MKPCSIPHCAVCRLIHALRTRNTYPPSHAQVERILTILHAEPSLLNDYHPDPHHTTWYAGGQQQP